ncbi:MAG: GTPase [Candidatus Aenigmarchaeota archaeon]|nr:GTPase [Candidatus Aenigmarchaeota archaeon]MDW8149625.1 GTPase [Candidatus Aenigmarchaeota archaeon]
MRIAIIGAAGRDFHDYLTYYRRNKNYKVVCFFATQIPNIENRVFPIGNIKIFSFDEIEKFSNKIEHAFLSFSDVSNEDVMNIASKLLSLNINFSILSPFKTMLKSRKPVISICATRTGAGKSTVARKVSLLLKKEGLKVAIVRHPMPYGDLKRQMFQEFKSLNDLKKYKCSLEEIEEYEPHIRNGFTVYAGIDYRKILRYVEKKYDVIVWDGGNNDLPFFKPTLHIVVADPFRIGDEFKYYHAFLNCKIADIFVINKINVVNKNSVEKLKENLLKINKKAKVILARSEISVENVEIIKNKRVLVVEDAPTVTHGKLSFSAGYIAAKKYNAKEIVDARKFAIGSIKKFYKKYPHIQKILPSFGYGEKQIKELENVINKVNCDSVVLGDMVDLGKFVRINKPYTKVYYELKDLNNRLAKEIHHFVEKIKNRLN